MDDRSKFVLEVQRDAKDFWSVLGVITPRVWGWWRPLWNCGVLFLVAVFSGVAVGTWMLSEGLVAGGDIGPYADIARSVAVVSGGLAILLPLVSNALLKPRFISENGAFLRPTTITIDENGVREESANRSSINHWPAIDRVLRAKTGFMLLTDHAGGIFIPYRSIEDRDARLAFVNERISKSGNGA